MKREQESLRSKALRATDQPNSVFLNTEWYAECPKHGRQLHASVIGGNCYVCQKERVG